MKRIIFAMAVMLVAVAASAQKYSGRIETGYQFATGHDAFDQYILHTTHGVSFLGDRLFAGVGIGVGFSRHSDIKHHTLPVYADFRYTMKQFAVRPFADFRIGYSHIWREIQDGGPGVKEKGGIYVAPSIGVEIPLINRFSLLISAGYAYSGRTIEFKPGIGAPNYPYSKNTYDIGGWFVTAGIQF